MPLTLTVLRCPLAVRPERRSVRTGALTVGRGPGVDWILPDPEQTISRRHFTVVLRAGGWHIIDESANGTFANRDDAPIGRGNRRPLHNNDRIRLGPYELEATVDEDAFLSRRGGSFRPAPAGGPPQDKRDPFAEAPKSRESRLRVVQPQQPSAPEPRDGTTLHDLTPSSSFHIPPRNAAPGPANDIGPAPGGRGEPRSEAQEAGPRADVHDSTLLAAFLAGVDMPDSHPADAETMFRRLGETFRALVVGLRAALVARAAMKRAFRIDQTMIRVRGNNPLKFAADDNDAIAAILGEERRTDMAPAAMVAEALRDLTLHETAAMEAMQSAALVLLGELEPARIRGAIERAGGITLLSLQKKARAWDTFEALHATLRQSMDNDFENVFSRAFAQAYEAALHELEAEGDLTAE